MLRNIEMDLQKNTNSDLFNTTMNASHYIFENILQQVQRSNLDFKIDLINMIKSLKAVNQNSVMDYEKNHQDKQRLERELQHLQSLLNVKTEPTNSLETSENTIRMLEHERETKLQNRTYTFALQTREIKP